MTLMTGKPYHAFPQFPRVCKIDTMFLYLKIFKWKVLESYKIYSVEKYQLGIKGKSQLRK